MKRILAIIAIASCCATYCFSQQLNVASGAQLTLFNGSTLTFNGLSLSPSANFTVENITIEKIATINYPIGTTYLPRTYLFSAPSTAFSGDIKINYQDTELQGTGLNENDLKLAIYDGTAWNLTLNNTIDATNNIITSAQINSKPLTEIAVVANLVLPLKWRAVSAARKGATVEVNWSTENEVAVQKFDVQRSNDGKNWMLAVANVPAKNRLGTNLYTINDYPKDFGIWYYRIKQIGLNGDISYSELASVNEQKNNGIGIFPNPATNYFTLPNNMDIKRVSLHSANGQEIQHWNGKADRYYISNLRNGIFFVSITTSSGTVLSEKIILKN